MKSSRLDDEMSYCNRCSSYQDSDLAMPTCVEKLFRVVSFKGCVKRQPPNFPMPTDAYCRKNYCIGTEIPCQNIFPSRAFLEIFRAEALA